MRPPEPIPTPPTTWTTPILRLLGRPFRGQAAISPPGPAIAETIADPAPIPTEKPERPSPKPKREAARKKRKPLPAEPAPATWIMVAPGRYIRAEEPPAAPELPEAPAPTEEPPAPDIETPAVTSGETSGPL